MTDFDECQATEIGYSLIFPIWSLVSKKRGDCQVFSNMYSYAAMIHTKPTAGVFFSWRKPLKIHTPDTIIAESEAPDR
ncbi:hypothetical protein ACFQ4A_13005 [Lentibacillus salinarum]|uniref:Uncharacterized protein n=1 Tax=Lentibacillus salinarum TaxID=446820 RepID=A0ABW3ZVZ6_9BACI